MWQVESEQRCTTRLGCLWLHTLPFAHGYINAKCGFVHEALYAHASCSNEMCTLTTCRALAHSLLEKVDRYLWSPRPTTLSPLLLMTHTLDQQQAQDRPPLVTGSSVHSLSSSLEDSNCHWGVKTGLSNDG